MVCDTPISLNTEYRYVIYCWKALDHSFSVLRGRQTCHWILTSFIQTCWTKYDLNVLSDVTLCEFQLAEASTDVIGKMAPVVDHASQKNKNVMEIDNVQMQLMSKVRQLSFRVFYQLFHSCSGNAH